MKEKERRFNTRDARTAPRAEPRYCMHSHRRCIYTREASARDACRCEVREICFIVYRAVLRHRIRERASERARDSAWNIAKTRQYAASEENLRATEKSFCLSREISSCEERGTRLVAARARGAIRLREYRVQLYVRINFSTAYKYTKGVNADVKLPSTRCDICGAFVRIRI